MNRMQYGIMFSTIIVFALSNVWAASESSEAQSAIARSHASLKAYPSATISLKDPKTGNIFYVESNGHRLVAFGHDGAVLWNVDVIEALKGIPMVGQSVIRDLKLDKDRLAVTIAKHTYANVDTNSGKIQFLGSD